MSLSEFPLPAKEIVALEKRSLELIRDSSVLSKLSSNIKDDAVTALNNLEGFKNRRHKAGDTFLNFESFLNLEIENRSCRIYFGGLINLSKSLNCGFASYHLAICKIGKKEKIRLLRRFHFDFDSGEDSASESKKPYFHL